MKVLGIYQDREHRSLRMDYCSRIVLEISSAWTEGYSDREDETNFCVEIRSGCYMFHIKTKKNEYFSKEIADELVKNIATSDITILDDYDMALFDAIDTTPDEYCVRNAFDEEYNEIPLTVMKI